jgi:hypothetical protein
MAGVFVAAMKKALADSNSQLVLNTTEDVFAAFGPFQNGSWRGQLKNHLCATVVSSAVTGFELRDLRAAISCCYLQVAINAAAIEIETLEMIASCIPGGSRLKVPTDPDWIDAMSLGRAIRIGSSYVYSEPRDKATADAAARLIKDGFKISISDEGIDSKSPVFTEATEEIVRGISKIGRFDALGRLWRHLKRSAQYEFNQYLFARNITMGPTHEPSTPIGFLLNLVVKVRDTTVKLSEEEAAQEWDRCVRRATDLCALLGVERVGQFWSMNASPKGMSEILHDIGLYDHLFAVRQWGLGITPELLRNFFGPCDAALSGQFGWRVADAVAFCQALMKLVDEDPTRITGAQLIEAGVNADLLDKLLKVFAHERGKVNELYLSPFSAKSADLFFKPLIPSNEGYIIAAASVAGPACYEALAAAVRAVASKETSEIAGKGTERAVEELLRQHSLPITFAGAKYNEGKSIDAGECDLVLEDDSNILLIECKAKTLTRATMASEPLAVLLDYGESVVASQLQAMQHQRILICDGAINFDDGTRLEHRGRSISRLSVTLLDLGSLQDKGLLWNLFDPLLRSSKVTPPSGQSKNKRVDQLNDALDDLRNEAKALSQRGINVREWAMQAASLSYGQLAALLTVATDFAQLVSAVRNRVTTATFNPLVDALIPRTARGV